MQVHKVCAMPHPVSLRPAGARIRELRRRSGIKPGAFAEQVGVSYSHLANVENGHHKGVSVEVLNRIAAALEVPIEELIAARPEPIPRPPGEPKPPEPTHPPNKPGVAARRGGRARAETT